MGSLPLALTMDTPDAFVWDRNPPWSSDREEEFLPTRHTLLARLKDCGDHVSWQEFFNLYWRFIYSVALKSGLTETEAQDVVQDTIIAVAARIGDFQYDRKAGTFKAWLMTVTRHKIQDHLRHRQHLMLHEEPWPEPAAEGREAALEHPEEVPGPCQHELIWEQEWRYHLLRVALDRIKDRINAKHYQVLDLCVLRGWAIHKVAQALRINLPQVYLIRSRLSRRLEEEVRLLESRGH